MGLVVGFAALCRRRRDRAHGGGSRHSSTIARVASDSSHAWRVADYYVAGLCSCGCAPGIMSRQLLTMRYGFVEIEYVADVSNRVRDFNDIRAFRRGMSLAWASKQPVLGAGSAHGVAVDSHTAPGVVDGSPIGERLLVLVDFLGGEGSARDRRYEGKGRAKTHRSMHAIQAAGKPS